MNRAVNSISLNIAEGCGKSSNKALDYHCEIAFGSTLEVAGASFLALDRGYITQEAQWDLYLDGERLAKGINAFRNTLA
jgi:four helix bundle protein